MKTLNEYHFNAKSTAFFTGEPFVKSLAYLSIGLSEEAGEVAGKIKKLYRDDNGILSKDRKIAIGLELGDTLWYLTMLADKLGYTLQDIATMNFEKLASRTKRGTGKGDGDNR